MSDPAQIRFFALVGLDVLILAWMFRDARARDAQPVLWFAALALGALFVHVYIPVLGALVYLIFRPRGRVDRCPHCGSGYIHYLAHCPKCEGPVKKECMRCRAMVPYTAGTCPECGALT